MKDGVYYTGDLAWRDEDGYYWFVGRADDVIKSSGYRIGPFEVESALMTHPAIVECAVTGVPDDIRGQIVKATCILGKDWKDKAGEMLVKELQDHVKEVTAPYKYPRIIEFVDELPKTISGKIRRVEIRQRDAK
jgi:acetyl-CoA synthetase